MTPTRQAPVAHQVPLVDPKGVLDRLTEDQFSLNTLARGLAALHPTVDAVDYPIRVQLRRVNRNYLVRHRLDNLLDVILV
jgi:hypothetical protein